MREYLSKNERKESSNIAQRFLATWCGTSKVQSLLIVIFPCSWATARFLGRGVVGGGVAGGTRRRHMFCKPLIAQGMSREPHFTSNKAPAHPQKFRVRRPHEIILNTI